MKGYELGGAYGTYGVEENCISWRNVKKRDHFEYQGVNGGIIFVTILKEESSHEGFFFMR
jgi:hypothetical protein